MDNQEKCCNTYKTKHRQDEEKRDLQIRLNRIAGQVNGVKTMIEEDRYCGDILIQLSAIEKSVRSLSNKILKSHLETCVIDEIKKGNNEIIDEVMELFNKFS